MNFKNILDIKNEKDEIILGYDETKREHFKINIKTSPSLIITGSTGIGKSRLLDQILLQLTNKHTSLEMNIVSIDTSGIELNTYASSKYAPRENLINAINDIDKTKVAIARILDEIERRKRNENLESLLVIAIDDNRALLNEEDIGEQIKYILKQIKDLNIFFILSTNYVYNSFFEEDQNTYASLLVTLDVSTESEANNVNISDANNLVKGTIKVRKGSGKEEASEKVYQTFDADDEEITELLKKYVG